MAIKRTYAVGYDGTVVRLDNHTGPWIDISTPNRSWVIRDVKSDPTNSDNVIIVGDNNGNGTGIQLSTNAGGTWITPNGNWFISKTFYNIWWVDSQTVWIVGQNGSVLLSTDGGLTFNNVSIPYTLNPLAHTYSIHALSDKIAIVGAADVYSLTPSSVKIYKTIDGGVSWFEVADLTTQLGSNVGFPHSVWLSQSQNEILVGTNKHQIYSNDNGSTFSFISTDPLNDSGRYLTWYPSYGTPQVFRHLGGTDSITSESPNPVSTFNILRLGGGANFIITEAHFYTLTKGYYVVGSNVYHTTDGALSETLSYSGVATLNSVWTTNTVYYQLVDCSGNHADIYTDSDLSAYVGTSTTISITSSDGDFSDVCWTVIGPVDIRQGTPIISIDTITEYNNCDECIIAKSSCGCPEGYTLNQTTGVCEKIESVQPTISSTIYTVSSGSKLSPTYGEYGLKIYEDITNLHLPIISQSSIIKDSSNYTLNIQYSNNTLSVWNSRLNDVGVWASGSGINRPPYKEWIGFSKCIEISETKTFYIGIAGDNRVRFKVDGVLYTNLNEFTDKTFKYWHIFPLTLTAGKHIIELYGYNDSDYASFGAEIYDATLSQLQAVSSSADLDPYIIFSTKDLIGQQFDLGEDSGHSCPDGYSYDKCDTGLCVKILTEPEIPCPCYKLVDCNDNNHFIYTSSTSTLYELIPGMIYKFDEYPDTCWIVEESDLCNGEPELTISESFNTCNECSPPPVEVNLGESCNLTKRLGEPEFNTKYCDPYEYIDIKCAYATDVYQQMVRKRYGINICCEEDFDNDFIRLRLLELGELYDPEICNITTPVVECCNEPCNVIATVSIPEFITCSPPENITINIILP